MNNSKEVVTLTLSEEVTFLNKVSIQETLVSLQEGSKIIIDGSKSKNIDYDVLEMIQDFKNYSSKLKNITVETINIPDVLSTGGH
jgi:MFS superfamily sulfate permease-like transporter